MYRSFFVSLILSAVAFPAYAGVIINEVAWMGTANSAQDEWVELYSDSGQNLEGWSLVTEDGGMTIGLSSIIPQDGYFLIERTDDTTVPNLPADLIAAFGNGLSNSGEVLILKNAAGAEIDRVDGSNSWAIGGNNTTKETLQKTSSGWITAAATPRTQNVGGVSSPPASPPPQSGGQSALQTAQTEFESGGSASESTKLKADTGEDRTVLAGAEVGFSGSVEGVDENSATKVRFTWNFGDGTLGEGKNAAHVFTFPGIYNVFLAVSFAGVSVTDSAKITVIENPVVILKVKPGQWVEIHNSSKYKIDFSNFGVAVAGDTPFYFPQNTFFEPNARVTLDGDLLGFEIPAKGAINLIYPNGKLLFSLEYPKPVFSQSKNSTPVSSKSDFETPTKSDFFPAGENEINLASVSSPTSHFSSLLSGNLLWLLGGLTSGLFVGAAFLFAKRYLL